MRTQVSRLLRLHLPTSFRNRHAVAQAHKAFKKHKADILLYVDRMDVVQRGFSDIPVLRAIAARFGPSAFFNTILVRICFSSLCQHILLCALPAEWHSPDVRCKG